MARLFLPILLTVFFVSLSFALPEGYHFCKLRLHPGYCSGRFRVWGYVPKREACVPFLYNGCLGNANNFATEQDCKKVCIDGGELERDSEPALEDYDNPEEGKDMENLNINEIQKEKDVQI